MSKISVFGEGISLAHVTRPLLVSRLLEQRGHDVRFFTSTKYQEWASTRGMPATSVWTPDPKQVYGRLRKLKPMLTSNEVEQMVSADLSIIDQDQPDVVIGDCRNSLRISCALRGIPYVAITNANCTPWYSGPPAIPPRAVLSERIANWGMSHLPTPWIEAMHQSACKRFAKPFAAVAKQYGTTVNCDDFRTVFTSDQLTLLADDERFNPTSNRPDHVSYIGPLDWPSDKHTEQATSKILNEVKRPKLLVIALGSTGSDAQLSCIYEALTDSQWSVVAVGVNDAKANQKASEWWQQTPFADMPTLLHRADAVLCHGGNGTIYQAIRAGKPVLSHPTFFDQETQSLLLKEAGLGRRLWSHEIKTPDQFLTTLNQFLEQFGTTTMPKLSSHGPDQAVEWIEKLIATNKKQAALNMRAA